eukprot:7102021-Alexandrium_andersonii.AAC.1
MAARWRRAPRPPGRKCTYEGASRLRPLPFSRASLRPLHHQRRKARCEPRRRGTPQAEQIGFGYDDRNWSAEGAL